MVNPDYGKSWRLALKTPIPALNKKFMNMMRQSGTIKSLDNANQVPERSIRSSCWYSAAKILKEGLKRGEGRQDMYGVYSFDLKEMQCTNHWATASTPTLSKTGFGVACDTNCRFSGGPLHQWDRSTDSLGVTSGAFHRETTMNLTTVPGSTSLECGIHACSWEDLGASLFVLENEFHPEYELRSPWLK